MLTEETNYGITHTGPGTPGGEYMRRYWQPVGLSRELTPDGQPRQIRVLSEDLVLFRDDEGRPGLLGLHCSHRATSLGYGRVEDGGIRCPFHGWLYDVDGHCLQQPAETPETTFADKIRHKAYPCREMGGLVFAYMGPRESIPVLPQYEVLVREDGTRQTSWYRINSNYLQNVEGAVDAVHFPFLHADSWSTRKQALFDAPRPDIQLRETDWGVWQKIRQFNPAREELSDHYAHFFMPAGFMRIEERGHQILKYQSWYVPIDDTHTARYQAGFAPAAETGVPYPWPEDRGYAQPGPENDYFRDYANVDTISGIPGWSAPGTAVKGFLCQDNMVNETQGDIVDRRDEHLSLHDRPLDLMRSMMLAGIAAVERGDDPLHVLRSQAVGEVIRVTGDDPVECR
ncbi:MAG TPA: Rieske 2Fe-2S domain-containing protein [Chloroflexota bacterium]|jgi:nitrite reductase/ring-hydroxylating ferredoxin subunit